jgi:hypothetical protein
MTRLVRSPDPGVIARGDLATKGPVAGLALC